jgi:hypothetical protein
VSGIAVVAFGKLSVLVPLAVLGTMFQGIHPVVEEMPIGLTVVLLAVWALFLLIVRRSFSGDEGRSRATTGDPWIRRSVLLFALPPLVVAVGVSCAYTALSVVGELDPSSIRGGFFGRGNGLETSSRALWSIVGSELLTGLTISAAMYVAVRELPMRGARRRTFPVLIAFTSWGLTLVHLHQCVLMLAANVQDLTRQTVKSLMPVQWGMCIAVGVVAVVMTRFLAAPPDRTSHDAVTVPGGAEP